MTFSTFKAPEEKFDTHFSIYSVIYGILYKNIPIVTTYSVRVAKLPFMWSEEIKLVTATDTESYDTYASAIHSTRTCLFRGQVRTPRTDNLLMQLRT